jgi:plastocyanin
MKNRRPSIVVGLAVVCAFLLAAAAPAKTVTVDISKLGFVPNAVTIQTGDAITWTNKDTGNHQVVCATCPFTSPVLAPGQSTSFTFAKVGKFTTVDPLNKNKKATVTVKQAPPGAAKVSIIVAPSVLTYGHVATISGTLSTGQANQKLEILAQPCGEKNAKVVATVTTTTAGAYTHQVRPALSTSYQAQFKPASGAVTSSAASVSVRPVVTLKRVALHKFRARVVAAQSFVGKNVVLQRYVAAKHRWNTVKAVFLARRAAAASPLAGSIVSSVTFKVGLKSGLKVRAVLPPAQAATCYLAASSATIRS